ncbi:MAG: NAD(P)/FAD-dependent oxidoreductase [Clostridia bacterium]|nr:NAD(P)/FAD-dependent oxidoreductase [Clostridia bacterium]
MGKKIIVAGAGHGGIAVAALLAKNGFDVTVYEKGEKDTLGYDWTDIFAPGALEKAGIPMPDKDKFTYKDDMTFYSPNESLGLRQHVPENELEIKMERRDIYAHLISHAESCGVKFVYGCKINSPLLYGNRVCGISTDKGDFYADLVIDAAGMDSPVRKGLPDSLHIEKEEGAFSRFNVYRAFYNRASDEPAKDVYKVYMLPQGKIGVNWVASEEEFTDVLIGRFGVLTDEDKEESLVYLKNGNARLGDTVVRGGQTVNIPVRQPLSIMVADGYAAIGDSAFMTVPIIGSGIANSLKAARMLADTVIADRDGAFSAETLWAYQVRYYKELGAGLSVLACVKLLLSQLEGKEVDYMFATGILNADDLTMGADSTSISSIMGGITPAQLVEKAKGVCGDGALMKKILSTGVRMGKVIASTTALPRVYNRKLVTSWAKKYESCFKI